MAELSESFAQLRSTIIEWSLEHLDCPAQANHSFEPVEPDCWRAPEPTAFGRVHEYEREWENDYGFSETTQHFEFDD